MLKPNVDTIIQNMAQQQGWVWKFQNNEFLIEVATMAGRTQVVHIMYGNDPDGMQMLYVWSPVGPAQLAQRDPLWLLNYNTELSWGACALFNNQLVIKDSQLASTADPEELGRMIINIARVADQLEAQLMGHHIDQA